MKICAVDGCDKPLLARGWCSKHWTRWQRHGDPLAGGTPKDGTIKRYFLNVVVPFAGDECLIWPFGRDAYGYGKIHLESGSGLVHRQACEAVHGPPPDLPDIQAAHNCGNGHKGCCNPNHLRWATRYDNSMDRVEHGTHNRGEQHKMVKLTEAQVIEIRKLKGLVSHSKLAERFGVSRQTIGDVQKRKSWFWLEPENDNSEPSKSTAA